MINGIKNLTKIIRQSKT
ncbi:MAG: hypothetical protein ISS19_00200 [Bacteroidales bacterium]|nr:hypothetical protein [Bacteroidales bacterium]